MLAETGLFDRRRLPRVGGFTIVELLVVIGIIAILTAILMPVVGRAREGAAQARCTSNMRQIAQAINGYASDFEAYPRAAAANDNTSQYNIEDWIHWQNTGGVNAFKIGQSVLTRYMGTTFDADVFRCPTDDTSLHTHGESANIVYTYSYAVNFLICTPHDPMATAVQGQWCAPKLDPTKAFYIQVHPSQIKNPAGKVLVIDENSSTADDGMWANMATTQMTAPPPSGPGPTNLDLLSVRHSDWRHDNPANDLMAITKNPNYTTGTGNCAFVDGHVEMVGRRALVDTTPLQTSGLAETAQQRYCDPFAE